MKKITLRQKKKKMNRTHEKKRKGIVTGEQNGKTKI